MAYAEEEFTSNEIAELALENLVVIIPLNKKKKPIRKDMNRFLQNKMLKIIFWIAVF